MYRGFKQECPNGAVNEDTFKEIYEKFFPYGSKQSLNSLRKSLTHKVRGTGAPAEKFGLGRKF